jgi:hypothetical protein
MGYLSTQQFFHWMVLTIFYLIKTSRSIGSNSFILWTFIPLPVNGKMDVQAHWYSQNSMLDLFMSMGSL